MSTTVLILDNWIELNFESYLETCVDAGQYIVD